jgi:hypothetical protein
VRAGTPRPDVRDTRVLRGNLLAATRIVCPDPAFATALPQATSFIAAPALRQTIPGCLATRDSGERRPS